MNDRKITAEIQKAHKEADKLREEAYAALERMAKQNQTADTRAAFLTVAFVSLTLLALGSIAVVGNWAMGG